MQRLQQPECYRKWSWKTRVLQHEISRLHMPVGGNTKNVATDVERDMSGDGDATIQVATLFSDMGIKSLAVRASRLQQAQV